MIKLNSKGFGAVETLLIVIIIGIIGGVGYLVFKTQKDTNQSFDNAAKSLNDPQKDVPDGYIKFFENTNPKFTFIYPANWTLEDKWGASKTITMQLTNDMNPNLQIYSNPASKTNNCSEALFTNYNKGQKTTIDGIQAFQYYGSTAGNQTRITCFMKDNNIFVLQYGFGENDEKNQNVVYSTLLKSFNFE